MTGHWLDLSAFLQDGRLGMSVAIPEEGDTTTA